MQNPNHTQTLPKVFPVYPLLFPSVTLDDRNWHDLQAVLQVQMLISTGNIVMYICMYVLGSKLPFYSYGRDGKINLIVGIYIPMIRIPVIKGWSFPIPKDQGVETQTVAKKSPKRNEVIGMSDDVRWCLGGKLSMIARWWQLKYFWYFHPENWGRWTHFDEHIFQMGWNHQLDRYIFENSNLTSLK